MKKFFLVLILFMLFYSTSILVSAVPLSSEQADMSTFNDCLELYKPDSSEFSIFVKFANPNNYSMFGFVENGNYFLGYFDGENFIRNRTLDTTNSVFQNNLAPVNEYRNFGDWINAYEPCNVPNFYSSTLIIGANTSFPFFNSWDSAESYFSSGSTDGLIYSPAPEFDPFSAEYDDDVPVPQVITKFNVVAGVTTPIISFTNGSTDYNVVIYGRWNSINDITLRQEKLRWVYDYSSLIHGDLECWVSDEDNRTSRENFDFFSDPHFTDTYQTFLLKYPLAERNITNDPSLFEKLTGYNEALHNFTELYMNLPNNAYSKPDFFFRYYYRDSDQNIHYSRWAHLTFPLIPPGENGFKTTTDQLWKGNLDYQIANKPLTSEEVLDVDSYFDTDQTKYNIMNNQQSYDLDEIDWTMSLSNLQSITSVFGQMPAFVATVFSCYPAWMVQLIGATITILCALAIYHGIRG